MVYGPFVEPQWASTSSFESPAVPRELALMRVVGATNASPSNVLRQNLEIIDSLRRAGHPFAGPAMIGRKVISRVRQRVAARVTARSEPG